MKYQLDDKCYMHHGYISTNLKYDFDKLWSLHPAKYGKIKIYGKIINTPRYTQSYLQSYNYSGMVHLAIDLPPEFEQFLEYANKLVSKFSYKYNQVLVNWYENGNHYIGAHSDNESQIIENSPILCISLGATRTMRIRHKETNEIVKDIILEDRSYIIMCGEMQQYFTHEILKSTVSNTLNEKRISLTFRMFNSI